MANQTSHTPNPWRLAHSGHANSPFVIYAGDKAPNFQAKRPLQGCNWIAEIKHDESEQHQEQIANAHLLLAAPELLELVRSITDDLGFAEWGTLEHAEENLLKLIEKWHAKGRAAIAKAEGRL